MLLDGVGSHAVLPVVSEVAAVGEDHGAQLSLVGAGSLSTDFSAAALSFVVVSAGDRLSPRSGAVAGGLVPGPSPAASSPSASLACSASQSAGAASVDGFLDPLSSVGAGGVVAVVVNIILGGCQSL